MRRPRRNFEPASFTTSLEDRLEALRTAAEAVELAGLA
jgi:hypothetical protein